MKTSDKVHCAAALIGRLGGHATARALTAEQRHAIASHAARAKWAKYKLERQQAAKLSAEVQS